MPQQKQVIIQKGVASYVQWGDTGPILLALHGWADKADTFRLLASALGGSMTIIAPDMPGFGGTSLVHEPMSLDDYVVWVKDFVDKVCPDVQYVLGHSNGGAIAIKLVSSEGMKLNGLILLASAGIRAEQKMQKKLMATAAKPAKMGLKLLPESKAHAIKKKAYKAVGSDFMVAEGMQETFKLVVGEDVRTDAENVRIPTLLLYGDQDQDTPVRFGTIFAESIPEAKLEIISDAGHFLHQDHCEDVARLIQEFTHQ